MRRLIAALLILILAAAPAMADLREAVNTLGKVKLDGLEEAIKALAAEPGEVPPKVLARTGRRQSLCAEVRRPGVHRRGGRNGAARSPTR